MVVYSDQGCPFLHRIQAVAHHLGLAPQTRHVDPKALPAELTALTPTGRIPLLRIDDLTLYESTVICDYLAESRSWVEAYPGDLAERARHRLALRQLDDVLMASFREEARGGPASRRVDEALDQIGDAIGSGSTAEPSLLAFAAAPMWLLWSFVEARTSLPRRIAARPRLCGWLESAARLSSVQATMPDLDLLTPHLELVESGRAG